MALVPPKPKLLDITVSSAASRLPRRIGKPSACGSSASMLAEPAMKPSRIISRQKIASCTLAAPSEWPDSALVDDSGGTASPKASRTARSSTRSPRGVEVPCVLR